VAPTNSASLRTLTANANASPGRVDPELKDTIRRLRAKLAVVDLGSRIVAVRGLGYRYVRPRRCHNSALVDSMDTES